MNLPLIHGPLTRLLQGNCVSVAWHKDDHHCHTLVGNVTHDKLVAALKKDVLYETCFITNE